MYSPFFSEHEALKIRLQALEVASQQDLEMYDRIEARISNILQSYASHVSQILKSSLLEVPTDYILGYHLV